MADFNLPVRVALDGFTMSPWAPGQSDVVAPYGPALHSAGPSTTGWHGTVTLFPAHQDGDAGSYKKSDRELMAFVGRLQGNRHRVKITLPSSMSGDLIPRNASATVSSGRVVEEGVAVTVNPASWGTWRPTAGSYCNIGEKLYLIDRVTGTDGTTLTLLPRVRPLVLDRPPGIRLTPNSAGPVVTFPPGRPAAGRTDVWLPAGLGTFRAPCIRAGGRWRRRRRRSWCTGLTRTPGRGASPSTWSPTTRGSGPLALRSESSTSSEAERPAVL